MYVYILTLYVCILMRYHYGVRAGSPPILRIPARDASRLSLCVHNNQVYTRIRQRYIVQGETDASDWCEMAPASARTATTSL